MRRVKRDLLSTFTSVRVINLESRPDRLKSFFAGLNRVDWPFRTPVVFRAIDGTKVPQTEQWIDGQGAWGCMQSHRQVLEQAMMDDVASLLVLEDDAVCRRTFVGDMSRFLAQVPQDWDGLMLGGQAMEVQPVLPGIVRCLSCHRTHAYAVRGAYMRALYQHWVSTKGHCDQRMAEIQRHFKVYAPDPFLIGQAQGDSNIAGTTDPARFWAPPSAHAPVILLQVPRRLLPSLRAQGLHTGFNRDPKSGIDQGLVMLFRTHHSEWVGRLRSWIEMIQWEAASMEPTRVCAIWHPQATAALIRSATAAPLFDVRASTLATALKQLPTTAKQLSTARRPGSVVLLRCPQTLLPQLRDLGFHTGYWRNPITDVDNGLASIFSDVEHNEASRIQALKRWFHVVDREAAVMNGEVAVWHERVTATALRRATSLPVCVIRANSMATAVTQWKRFVSAEFPLFPPEATDASCNT